MAKIDEERVIVRISRLVRDTVDVNTSTVVTANIQSDIEQYAQTLVGDAYLVESEIVTYVTPSP